MAGDVTRNQKENGDHSSNVNGKESSLAPSVIIEAAPIMAVAAMLGLIFGGCCSNV